jgi:carbonic anhydrase
MLIVIIEIRIYLGVNVICEAKRKLSNIFIMIKYDKSLKNYMIRIKEIPELKKIASQYKTQHPKRVLIICSDSRIPEEIFKENPIGENFVIRSAGNLLDQAGKESLKYAIEHLGVREIVVIGHTYCGAVNAALNNVNGYQYIVSKISQYIKKYLNRDPIEANVLGVIDEIKEVLKEFHHEIYEIKIFGYIYDIHNVELKQIY